MSRSQTNSGLINLLEPVGASEVSIRAVSRKKVRETVAGDESKRSATPTYEEVGEFVDVLEKLALENFLSPDELAIFTQSFGNLFLIVALDDSTEGALKSNLPVETAKSAMSAVRRAAQNLYNFATSLGKSLNPKLQLKVQCLTLDAVHAGQLFAAVKNALGIMRLGVQQLPDRANEIRSKAAAFYLCTKYMLDIDRRLSLLKKGPSNR